jgi:hypothetical protein
MIELIAWWLSPNIEGLSSSLTLLAMLQALCIHRIARLANYGVWKLNEEVS